MQNNNHPMSTGLSPGGVLDGSGGVAGGGGGMNGQQLQQVMAAAAAAQHQQQQQQQQQDDGGQGKNHTKYRTFTFYVKIISHTFTFYMYVKICFEIVERKGGMCVNLWQSLGLIPVVIGFR